MQETLKKVTVYLTPSEYAQITQEADDHGITLSAYVRARLGLPVTHRGAPEGNRNRARTSPPRKRRK